MLRIDILRKHLQPETYFDNVVKQQNQLILHEPTSRTQLPLTFKQLVITKKSNNYREAAQVMQVPLQPPTGRQVLVRVLFAGIEASEIMISAGVVCVFFLI